MPPSTCPRWRAISAGRAPALAISETGVRSRIATRAVGSEQATQVSHSRIRGGIESAGAVDFLVHCGHVFEATVGCVMRALRVLYPGAVYHVTARGNERQLIFRDAIDYREFLRLLELVVERYGWICHGYCLMGNHYHLLIETPRAN